MTHQEKLSAWGKKRAKIYRLFQSGMHQCDIARKVGLTRQRIKQILIVEEAANGTTRIRRPKPNGSAEGR